MNRGFKPAPPAVNFLQRNPSTPITLLGEEPKETFSYFWQYKSVIWASGFLDYWSFRAMRSRLEPMKNVARMLRAR